MAAKFDHVSDLREVRDKVDENIGAKCQHAMLTRVWRQRIQLGACTKAWGWARKTGDGQELHVEHVEGLHVDADGPACAVANELLVRCSRP